MMKAKIYKIHPDNNFLSSNPTKTIIQLKTITNLSLPDKLSIDGPKSLMITPYRVYGGPRFKTARDTSWGGSLNLRSWRTVDEVIEHLLGFDEVYLMGALESLNDIRPLLKALRIWMINKSTRKAVFMPNLSSAKSKCFREWSEKEAEKLFKYSGFEISSSEKGLILNCTEESYRKFLDSNNLPHSTVKHIVFTREHPDYKITGGIGSYVKESTRLYGEDSAVLIIDDNNSIDNKVIDDNRWLSLQKLIGIRKYSQLLKYDFQNSAASLLEATYQILFLYDQINFLEGSDYGHLNLSRIIQAKETGLLPRSLKTITVCHGSNIYVDNASGRYPSKDDIPVIQKEVYSIINSDITIFLTNFVKDLYASYGIVARNPIKYRLPIDLSCYYGLDIKEPSVFKDIKNIYYIGKLSKMKGGDIFLKFIAELAEQGNNYNVICASTYTSSEEEVQESLKRISNYPNIKLNIQPYERNQLLKELNDKSKDSIAVIPYPGDNHPNVILELMLTGMDFIAADSGGIPELIPKKDQFTSQLSSYDLLSRFNYLAKNRNKRLDVVRSNRSIYMKQQNQINKTYSLENLKALPWLESEINNVTEDRTISVIIPCYNTDLKYIKELALSLGNQSLPATEILFINDGSTQKDYLDKLDKTIKLHGYGFKYKILDKPNGGLSSARNFGLRNSRSKYIVTIDSDDIVDNYFLENLSLAVSTTDGDSIIGVTPFLNAFYDGRDATKLEAFHYQYMPYGSSLATAFFPHNTYGSAAVIFNRQKLLNVTGGWDESSKAMFEDWALYVKLDSLGYRVNVMPAASYFYRVRDNSMLRTYSSKEGYQRLISNYIKLSKYESYLLFSQLFNYYEFNLDTNGIEHALTEDESKRMILQNTFNTYDTSRISELITFSKALEAYREYVPVPIRRLLNLVLKLAYRFIRKVYSFFPRARVKPTAKFSINTNSAKNSLVSNSFRVIDKLDNTNMPNKMKLAVAVHIFYTDIADELFTKLSNIDIKFKLLISTDSQDKKEQILKILSKYNFDYKIKIFKNIGRDIAPSFIGFKKEILDSDYFLHLHTKKSEYNPALNEWRGDILLKLLGSKKVAEQNLSLVASKDVGAVIPAPPDFIKAHMNWGTRQDFKLTKGLLKRSNIKIGNSNPLYFPAGSMFFAKTECIKPMIESLRIEDFSEESGQISGTMAHAVERSILFYVEKSGKKWIEVDVSKSGSHSYRYPEYSLLKKHRLIFLYIKLESILKNFKNFYKSNVNDK